MTLTAVVMLDPFVQSPPHSFTQGLHTGPTTVAPKETRSHKDMTRAGQPSREAAQRHLLDLRDALDAIRRNRPLHLDSVAWPAGLDRSILDGLPLEVRTRNCLLQAELMEGDNPLTVWQLLRLQNFGRKSLRDLL